MKFVLYVLGALCFVQLAFANTIITEEAAAAGGLTPANEALIQCVDDQLQAASTAARALLANMRGECFNDASFSPATAAAIATVRANVNYVNQATSAYFSSRNRIEKAGNFFRVMASAQNLLRSITVLLNTSYADGSSVRQCVKDQVNVVVAPLKQITACMRN